MSKPWIGNNKFVIDITDSIDNKRASIPKSNTGGFDSNALHWIPVRAWVYNDDNGQGAIDEAEVEDSIERLNEYFAGQVNNTGNAHEHTTIQFYLKCDITYIDNSDYALNPSSEDIDDMWSDHSEVSVLNIHFAQEDDDRAGRGNLRENEDNFSCYVVTNHDNAFGGDEFHLNSTLPHEVGHAFDFSATNFELDSTSI
jgi:hypothetical protein